MKKILCFILSLICILGAFASCSQKLDLPEETKTKEEVQKVTETEEEWNGKVLSTTFKAEDLEKIPVASSSMSEKEVRDLAVQFMYTQNSIPWVCGDYYMNKYMDLKKGKIYLGMPYNVHSGSIYCFLDFVDPETGIFKLDKVSEFDSYFGNDCADQVFWSWARFSSSISFTQTRYMNEKTGCLKVGRYTFSDSIEDFANYETIRICNENGENVMYSSYAELKPGDAVVQFNAEYGHAMMVQSEINLVKNGGVIDPEASYISFLEQGPWEHDAKYENSNAIDIGTDKDGSENKYTFKKLFELGYLPMTCKELRNPSLIQKAQASIVGIDKNATTTAKDLNATVLKTNYRISTVKYTIESDDGEVLYKKTYYGNDGAGTEGFMYEMPLDKIVNTFYRNKFSGNYHGKITVTVGSGETLVAFDGTLVF